MINDFLATLDNIATAPANVVWPIFTPRIITGTEAVVRSAIIGANLSREQHFSRCLLLTDLVSQSPLSSYVTARDSRITYSRAAIAKRFAVSGPVIAYTGLNPPGPTLYFQALPGSPDIDAWVLQSLSSSILNIVDDSGNITQAAVTFTDGLSNPIILPNGSGQVQLVGTGIEASDSWELSYRAAGATWVQEALGRMSLVDPRSLMSEDILDWYDHDLLQLDRLAAIVAALGTK